MPLRFAENDTSAIHTIVVEQSSLERVLENLTTSERAWAEANSFTGAIGQALLIPNTDGTIAKALLGYGTRDTRARKRFALSAAVQKLPAGNYQIVSGIEGQNLANEAFGWLMTQHVFDRYKAHSASGANLIAPDHIDAKEIEAMAAAEALIRDLINTPAQDLGPEDLQLATEALAEEFGAASRTITGSALLNENLPMIHAVGRASDTEPRLVELKWGSAGPKLTLVGKGVCFDTGGLDLKPASAMALMKKDMGGAANVLGLARLIMARDLPLQLRVLIPAVENSVAGNAFRPGDILTSRKGLTVEVNNTDAEGRLVLADALALADEGKPDLIISMATLTGAARVAVGPDLAPFYTDDEGAALALAEAAAKVSDPVWRLPFYEPYETMIEPANADLDNAPSGGFAGSITAALFLRRFVENAPYMHFDIYGWQPTNAPARPKGGVGQGPRALLAALPKLLDLDL